MNQYPLKYNIKQLTLIYFIIILIDEVYDILNSTVYRYECLVSTLTHTNKYIYIINICCDRLRLEDLFAFAFYSLIELNFNDMT